MIEIAIDGRCLGKYGSGFTVELKYGKYYRLRTIDCGKITTNQAELKALEYALKSIKNDFESEKILIKTTGRYAALMLERVNGAWTKTAINNSDMVAAVREQYAMFKNISIITEDLPSLREKTDKCVKDKMDLDIFNN